jgi:hypothetical protein
MQILTTEVDPRSQPSRLTAFPQKAMSEPKVPPCLTDWTPQECRCALSTGDQTGSARAVASLVQRATAKHRTASRNATERSCWKREKLTAKTHEYRMRVGNLRVLFTLEGDLISVYRVKDRKEVYE